MDKMPYTNTLYWFSQLAKEDEPSVALSYCMPAVRLLTSKLKDKTVVVDNEPSLCFAAAVIGYYKYSLTDEFSKYSKIRAGDLTLDMPLKEFRSFIKELLSVALEEAKPFLRSGTVFKSVMGG